MQMCCHNTPSAGQNTLHRSKPGLNTQYAIRFTFEGISRALVLVFLSFSYSAIKSQTLPVGTPLLEEYYRRMQLLGKIDSSISFTVRPLTSQTLKLQDIFNTDTGDSGAVRHSNIRTFARGKGKFQVLPITLQAQYNSKRPYGWNDGPMVPARGFQSVISAGVFARYGPLSIQLRPEMVYAQNQGFPASSPDISGSYIDLPERFGDKPYKKVFPGQSSVRLTFGPVSFGLSSENLWWGPGVHNSLLMSNSAPGFNHLTLNTIKPIRTAIGSIEAQLIGGRLEGSGFTNKPDDWRYLSALTFSYQPRWVTGLFLGLTRSFQAYSKEVNRFSDYFPFFQSLSQKNNYDSNQPQRDQLASMYIRWVWKEALAETYFEYGRGDHSANLRDLALQPEHSRAYLIGIKKVIKLTQRKDENLSFNFEVANLKQSINNTIRNAGPWYTHSSILNGYTHRGEIIGAYIIPGSNLYTLEIEWFKHLNNFGIMLDHYRQSDDNSPPQKHASVYSNGNNTSAGLYVSQKIARWLLNTNLQLVSGKREMSKNWHIQIGLTYGL